MIALIIFAVSLLVYILTLAPTISFFDSGEMISGSYTLGVSHPPGYPVYVTLGKLFTFLPLNNVAYRVNLMSAFFASMTSVMIYYITRAALDADDETWGLSLPRLGVKRLGIPEIAGIFSAMAFTLSYNLWAWAVVSKFYTLNAFVVSCILMLLIRWRKARKEEGDVGGGHSVSYIYVLAFVCGISGVVHISQFVLLPVYLLYILIVDGRVFFKFKDKAGRGDPDALTIRQILKDARRPSYLLVMAVSGAVFTYVLWSYVAKPEMGAMRGVVSLLAGLFFGVLFHLAVRGVIRLKMLLIMGFFFILGHSIYLHLPIRALQEPLINWGGATNWRQFLWCYNREGYPVVGGTRTWSLFWAQVKSFNLVREFTWAGIPLIIGGLWGHLRKDWRHFAILLFGSVFMTSVIVVMGNPPLENIFLLEQFYIPVYIFLCVIMGGAVYLILKKRPAGPLLIGVTLTLLFLGEVPMGYLDKVFTGSTSANVEDTAFLGAHYPPYLYFLFFLGMAAFFAFTSRVLIKGRNAYYPYLYVSLFAVIFLLYPAYQLKAHYWKNDRSVNYLAYDMGNGELTFAKEFAVLLTWGDSGAFPMWYLQDVEQKRPDVLLVHTPHLPLDWFLDGIRRDAEALGDRAEIAGDYNKLRNFNGIKAVEQLMRMPEDFRDPAGMIQDIIQYNPERVYAFDYSSRYSINMPYDVFPIGLTYRKLDEKTYVEENLRTWRYLVTRGLPDPTISLDLDETKAVSIYGYVHADVGKKYNAMGLSPLAGQEFSLAVKYAPELWDSLQPYMR